MLINSGPITRYCGHPRLTLTKNAARLLLEVAAVGCCLLLLAVYQRFCCIEIAGTLKRSHSFAAAQPHCWIQYSIVSQQQFIVANPHTGYLSIFEHTRACSTTYRNAHTQAAYKIWVSKRKWESHKNKIIIQHISFAALSSGENRIPCCCFCIWQSDFV